MGEEGVHQRPAWGGAGGCDAPAAAVVERYAAACRAGGGDDDAALLLEAQRRVAEQLTQSAQACCLVCLEDVRPVDPIWSCPGCHEAFHLGCLQAWARQQLAAAAVKAEQRLDPRLFPAAAAETRQAWGCPKCRREEHAIPRAYRCFCGSTIDPPNDPWSAPHR